MGESLIQLYRMGEEGSIGCKALMQGKIVTKPWREVPAKRLAPAAAMVQRKPGS